MLRARSGNLFMFGIDAENVRRLKADQPISIKLAELDGPPIELVIFYGETLDDCSRKLLASLGTQETTPPGGH